jgi:cation transport ATPase
MHLLFSPYLSLVLAHVFKCAKAIFKLKFSSINLLMTIAVVAAFIWENPEAAVVLYSMF